LGFVVAQPGDADNIPDHAPVFERRLK